ncbi:MAG: hypothetical protein CVV33_06250 [Methanomicrobiales archaeon HGW-Methanomicrobiales-4]|nr:MAG: hypothetical protein CVV33_06250 [Methanomicrobiales archaeon HGW-Methanomicrobiales-4]
MIRTPESPGMRRFSEEKRSIPGHLILHAHSRLPCGECNFSQFFLNLFFPVLKQAGGYPEAA